MALKESESRYRILLENTPDIIAHFDANGRFLYVSPSVAAITDIPPNELIGKTYRDIDVNSNDAFLCQARIERVVISGKPDEAEINIETKLQGTNVFNWRLFPIRELNGNKSVLSLARNVTEQKRLEREYQALFNEMLSPLAVHEVLGTAFDKSENYRLIAVNPAFERMTGLGSEDVLGRTLKEVLPNTDSRWLDIYGQVANSGTPVHFEAHFTDLGRLFEVTAFRSATRQVACIYTDISERRRLQEQYHQSAKLEAIGRLASGVAHDLNNLLMPILGYSEVALEMLAPDDSRAAPLKEIRTAGQQAKGLVRQLLTFGQKQRLEVQKVDLNSVVSGFALLLERALRENIRFSLITSPTPLWLEADVGQLELILMTLAVNAQESMPSGGTLTIEVSTASVGTSTTQYGSSPPPSNACLTIRDDGPGLDIESRERLFEPYFSTRSNKEEKQLGLSTVHAIVVQHGGSVSVRSAPGMGTEFVILLPLVAAARQVDTSVEAQSPQSYTKTTGTILVVEDNPLVRDLTVRALETQGYQVRSASDGKDCLARLGNSTEPFDLLLTDIIMPDMNGKALFEVLSARYPRLKVAYMSGYSKAFITQQQGLEPDVTFLQKPFSMRKLLATVREVLDR
jgi:PAS domain S-box-containing protein